MDNPETTEAPKRYRLYLVDDQGEALSILDNIDGAGLMRTVYSEHFWKLYLSNFLKVLGTFKSKEVAVLAYILENMSASDNRFHESYRSMSKNISRQLKKSGGRGISLDSVQRAMQGLQEAEFMVREENGAYIVSPDIMVKGDERKRKKLREQYKEAATKAKEKKDAKAAAKKPIQVAIPDMADKK